jgi:ABC-2 type transport system permease protein
VNALRLFGKDVTLLRRSPLLLALLVGYPLLVALLVAAALQSGERKPSVAFVNLDHSGHTVLVGKRRISVDQYAHRLADEVDLKRLGPSQARSALDDGRVSAILTIPPDFITKLQAGGLATPTISLVTSRRDAIEGEAIARRLQSAVYRLNQSIASSYVQQVAALVTGTIRGGPLQIGPITGSALGLVPSEAIVRSMRDDFARAGQTAKVRQADQLLHFIHETALNLGYARQAATSLKNPVQLTVTQGAPGREPLTAFGFAGALLVTLALVGVLLAAAALSSEREDNALVRLARGLVSPGALVGEKMAFAAAACLLVGLVLLGAVALFTSLAVGRWGLWLAALLLAGLAFGAFGVFIGALARETRTALLAALMLALPLLFLGLVPGNAAAHAISQLFAFGPAFSAFQTLLVEPTVPGDLALQLAQLALVAAVFGGLAALLVARRQRA